MKVLTKQKHVFSVQQHVSSSSSVAARFIRLSSAGAESAEKLERFDGIRVERWVRLLNHAQRTQLISTDQVLVSRESVAVLWKRTFLPSTGSRKQIFQSGVKIFAAFQLAPGGCVCKVELCEYVLSQHVKKFSVQCFVLHF